MERRGYLRPPSKIRNGLERQTPRFRELHLLGRGDDDTNKNDDIMILVDILEDILISCFLRVPDVPNVFSRGVPNDFTSTRQDVKLVNVAANSSADVTLLQVKGGRVWLTGWVDL